MQPHHWNSRPQKFPTIKRDSSTRKIQEGSGEELCRKLTSYIDTYNRRQNKLRHFALNWAFLYFTDFKRGKYSFSSPIPSMQCCAAVRAIPLENNKHLNFEWRGQGRGVDSFVLRSYPISVQSLNNFVADCRLWYVHTMPDSSYEGRKIILDTSKASVYA